jgi:hypothetical protein|tara:strand:- start:251 stop:439 length:189 start_codon:yes stop_codon:yes gene_type:complete
VLSEVLAGVRGFHGVFRVVVFEVSSGDLRVLLGGLREGRARAHRIVRAGEGDVGVEFEAKEE